MTVSTTALSVPYTGNGVTTAFATTFPFLEASHLVVVVAGATIGSSQYVVTGGNGLTGTVTFLAAPASGAAITITREVPATQLIDYLRNDPFPAESHEKGLDKLTMLVQQVLSGLGKAFRFSDAAVAAVTQASALSKFPYINAAGALTFVAGTPAQPVTHTVEVVYPITGQTVIPVSSYTPGSSNLAVFRKKVGQTEAGRLVPGIDYAESSSTAITLGTASTTGDAILLAIGDVYDVTLTRPGMVEQSITGVITPTLTLTTISYTPGVDNVWVFRNGSRLRSSDFTLTNSTTITLAFTPSSLDEFDIAVGQGIDITSVSRTTLGTTLYPLTTGESTAGVVPTDYAYRPGDFRRYGAVGNGTTDDTVAVRNAGLANKLTFGEAGKTYRLTGNVAMSANQVMDATGITFNIAHSGTGFTLTTGCVWVRGKLTGPGAAYSANSIALYATGTRNGAAAAPTRVSDISINDVEVDGFGNAAIECRYVDRVRINRPKLKNLGYAGVFGYSAREMRVFDPWIDTISGETTSGQLNAYGVTFTSLSGSGVDTVRDPVSVDCGVYRGTIRNIPTWHGLDTHGGSFIEFKGVNLTNCRRGAVLTHTTTSAPADCTIEGCEYENFYTAAEVNSNGTFKRGEAWWDVGASSAVRATRNTIRNNKSVNAGAPNDALGGAIIENAQDGAFSNNRSYGSYNAGLLVDENVRRYEITGNVFTDVRSIGTGAGAPTDNPHGIRFRDAEETGITVAHNTFARKNSALDVYVGVFGLFFDAAANRGVYLGPNTYDGVTTPQSGTFTGVTGEVHTIPSIASAAALTVPFGTEVALITGTTNITSMTATGRGGQRVTLIFAGILTFTDGSNLRLAGNLVTTADDSITLVCDGSNWTEISRSVN